MSDKIACKSCGFENLPTHKTCVTCGTPLPQESKAQKLFKKWISIFVKLPEKPEVSEFSGEVGSSFKTEKGDKYVVVKNIGSGSYGEVFLVEREKKKGGSPKLYALKMLRMWAINPRDRKKVEARFLQEYKVAKMATDVGSPYLVHALDKGYINGNPFFVMDYCEGGSLRDNIRKQYSEIEILDIASGILKGLLALHSQGIIHRDLKPENILFHDNQVKLTDFGIAGYLNSRLTETNVKGGIKFTLGTDAYIPPEQFDRANAFKALGSVTDVFAFGIVMFELITHGKFPYGNPPDLDEKDPDKYNQEFEIYCEKVRKNDWQLLQNLRGTLISNFWADLIEKCIEADNKKRISNIEEILTYLPSARHSTENIPKPTRSFIIGQKMVLRVMNGWQPDLTFNLSDMMTEKGFLTLGRHEEDEPTLNDISIVELEEPCYISRTQATIELGLKTGNWFIRDGQFRKVGSNFQWVTSRNGTFLNSVAVGEKGTLLKPGDIITLGDTTLRVELE